MVLVAVSCMWLLLAAIGARCLRRNTSSICATRSLTRPCCTSAACILQLVKKLPLKWCCLPEKVWKAVRPAEGEAYQLAIKP
jgi:hypothetical protein